MKTFIEYEPPNVGDRVVVHGLAEPAHVENVQWVPDEHRWIIFLDWKTLGKSKVYSTDEGEVWFRYRNMN